MKKWIALIKETFTYDPVTGIVGSKRYPCGNAINQQGYISVKIQGKTFLAHRVAFVLMTGKFPENQVDHINRVRHDNRWCNLRDVTQSVNQRNTSAKGVTQKKSGKWVAQVERKIDGKRRNFTKTCDTYEEALRERKKLVDKLS